MMTTFAAIFGALQLLTLFITPVTYVYLGRVDRVLRVAGR